MDYIVEKIEMICLVVFSIISLVGLCEWHLLDNEEKRHVIKNLIFAFITTFLLIK